MVFASRALNDRRLWRAFALIMAFGLVATGCGGGGGTGGADGGGPVPGVPLTDLHGDIPSKATRIIVDGPKIVGAINPQPPDPITGGGDVDFFVFTGVQGLTYCFQMSGFDAPFPSMNDGSGGFPRIQMIKPDGATQMLNTTGVDGGEPYGTDPGGIDPVEGIILGDGRILFWPQITGNYFIKIQHADIITGTGNYVFSVASVQTPTTFGPFDMRQVDGRSRSFEHSIFILDDMGEVAFDGFTRGTVGVDGVSFETLGGGNEDLVLFFSASATAFTSTVSFDPDIDAPEVGEFHLHVGTPNTLDPRSNSNLTSGDSPHPFFLSFPVTNARRTPSEMDTSKSMRRVQVPTPDGKIVTVPAEITVKQAADEEGNQRYSITGVIDLSSTVVSRGATELTFNDLRTFNGFDFYADVHWTPDLDLDLRPTVSSPAFGDSYTLFESNLRMNFNSVVNRDSDVLPEILRGIGDGDLHLFYESSLHAFQVIDQFYSTLSGIYAPGEFDAFAGMAISVHRGAPGQIGPRIIDLGTMPAPEREPDFKVTPGIRNVIKQLGDSEVEILREAFYGGGFYVQISNPQFPNGLMRAEGFLEIQTFPLDGTVRSSGGLVPKGTINFASEYGVGGGVTVISNGKIIGVLDEFIAIGGDPPGCGLTPSAAAVGAEYSPGEYYYRAFAEDGTEWEGHFEVASGTCETIVLSVD